MILTSEQECSSSKVFLSLFTSDVAEQTPHGKHPQALRGDLSALKQEGSSVC